MKRIMIDIEGLGDGPDGVVLSVAAVVFTMADARIVIPDIATDRFSDYADPELYVYAPAFQVNISISSSMRHGLTVDGETIAWWMGAFKHSPDDRARHSLFTPSPKPLLEALKEISKFLEGADEYWANPVSYDLVTLAGSYRAVRKDKWIPWRWKRCMDVRTYLKEVPFTEYTVPRYGSQHDPVWDAANQATWVKRAFAWKAVRLNSVVTPDSKAYTIQALDEHDLPIGEPKPLDLNRFIREHQDWLETDPASLKYLLNLEPGTGYVGGRGAIGFQIMRIQ